MAFKFLGWVQEYVPPDYNLYFRVKIVRAANTATVYRQKLYRFTEGFSRADLGRWYSIQFDDIIRDSASNDIKVLIEMEYQNKDLENDQDDFYGFAMTEMMFKKASRFVSGISTPTIKVGNSIYLGDKNEQMEIRYEDVDPSGGAPAYRWSFDPSATVRFESTVEGSGAFVNYSSDRRLKTNIIKIDNPLEKVKKLQGITFDWNSKAYGLGFEPLLPTETGLISQDVEKVIPDAIQPAPFNMKYKTIQYEKVIPLLVEAIKTLSDKIDILEFQMSGSL
jgi:hypothetical protein